MQQCFTLPSAQVGSVPIYVNIAAAMLYSVIVAMTLAQRARSEEEAYKQTVECITGPISKLISTKGMPAVYEALDDHGKEVFKKVRADVTLST